MKNKIVTDLEQSRKLFELGIDTSTADMWWAERYARRVTMDLHPIVDKTPSYYLSLIKPTGCNYSQDIIYDIPAWSLSALMNLLPSELELPDMYGGTIKYEIRIRKYSHANELDLYQIAYATNQGLSKSWHDIVNTSEQEDLLDAVFEMVCYIKENKWI